MKRGSPFLGLKLTWPRLPQILAWMEGYICFSFIVIVISLSRMAVTRWRLASSLCLQKRTKFRSQGVMYSRQRCLSSIPVRKHFELLLNVHRKHKYLLWNIKTFLDIFPFFWDFWAFLKVLLSTVTTIAFQIIQLLHVDLGHVKSCKNFYI